MNKREIKILKIAVCMIVSVITLFVSCHSG
ncbi:hypothetical protein SAMN05443270_3461 [Lacrimispora sphenoides]|nr:hypothetical protein SAMN05443270_3461 [Lacrimispora sphenoides]